LSGSAAPPWHVAGDGVPRYQVCGKSLRVSAFLSVRPKFISGHPIERGCATKPVSSCRGARIMGMHAARPAQRRTWLWSKNVWLQSRSLLARGRVGLEVHHCLCKIDPGNIFISTVMGNASPEAYLWAHRHGSSCGSQRNRTHDFFSLGGALALKNVAGTITRKRSQDIFDKWRQAEI
jgi:hypothetical protein